MNTQQAAKALRKLLGLRSTENDISTQCYAVIHPKTKRPILAATVNGGITNAGIKCISEDWLNTDTADQIAIIGLGGAAYVTTTLVVQHLYSPGGSRLAFSNIGTETLPPVIVANGLDIGGDQTNGEGRELFSNFFGADGRPFVVGNDRPFFFQAQIKVADISGLGTMLIGFRKAAVNDATYTNYSDYAALGVNTSADPGALKQLTGLAGTDVATDTTQTLADNTIYTVRINVGATGIATFLHDAGNSGGLLSAPTAGAAYTLADGLPVLPFIHIINASDLAGEVAVLNWTCGFQ